METNIFTHEWTNQTTLHPLGLIVVLIAGLLMQLLPRRYSLWPIIAVACFVAPAQRLVIFTLDFNLIRLMVLFGFVRLTLRQEWSVRFRALDWAMLSWTALSVIMPTLATSSSIVLVNKLGYAFEAAGIYFICRCLVRDRDDLGAVVLGFVTIAIPVAAAFLVEKSTGRNVFAFFGGVPEITMVRNGRLRCQGAFAHPILAGCFWAAIMPLVVAMWWNGWRLTRVAVGLGLMGLIVVLCASSTPVMAMIFCVLGAALFPVRSWMRPIRWGLLFMIIFLHLIMKAPVWHLLARIDIVSGSTGWHRFHIIDEAINHANEWLLLGSNQGTAHWGWGLEDVTNFYVVQGLHGGILQLTAFVVVIALAFAGVGRAWRAAAGDRGKVMLAWALGVALFTHVMNFIAVSYFGQITLVWYFTLGTIAATTAAKVKVPARAGTVDRPRADPVLVTPATV